MKLRETLQRLRRGRAGSAPFNYDGIPTGYYQTVVESGSGMRRFWHLHKFQRVLDILPSAANQSILDVGCFAGTFLSMVPERRFSRQVGVDILENQVAYAQQRFGTAFREFRYIPDITHLAAIAGQFDVITLIEVVEHLQEVELAVLLERVLDRLKPGGSLAISTPNYASAWPLLEVIVNLVSDVSYEEQHLTRLTYFNAHRRLCALLPRLGTDTVLDIRTTTHFATPFIAALSLQRAERLAAAVPHQHWAFPFGNLVMLVLRKVAPR